MKVISDVMGGVLCPVCPVRRAGSQPLGAGLFQLEVPAARWGTMYAAVVGQLCIIGMNGDI